MQFNEIKFDGEYMVFFPKQDVDEISEKTIESSLKKVFKKVKVYFTDDEDIVILQRIEKQINNVVTTPVNEVTNLANSIQNKVGGNKNLDNKQQKKKRKTDEYIEEQGLNKIDKNEGRDPNW